MFSLFTGCLIHCSRDPIMIIMVTPSSSPTSILISLGCSGHNVRPFTHAKCWASLNLTKTNSFPDGDDAKKIFFFLNKENYLIDIFLCVWLWLKNLQSIMC